MDMPPKNPAVTNTTPETFEKDVLERSREVPIVLDFWAPWCAPCRALGPVLEKLAQEYGNRFALVKANSDELPEAAAQFGVQGIPAVYAVLDGEVIDFFQGAVPENVIRTWLDRVLVQGALRDAHRTEARSAHDAEGKYRQILAGDPQQSEAQIGLARCLLAQDRLADSQAIVEQLERRGFLEPAAQKLKAALELRGMAGTDLAQRQADAQARPNDLDAQYRFAEALIGSQRYEESLEVLLALVQRDRKNVGEKARHLMIEVFQALPEDSELTSRFRRKLSMALY